MANYDEFKKRAKDAFDTIADVSVEAYKIAEEKARILARKAKLSAGITHERAIIRRLKMEIGNVYYKLNSESPGEEFKQFCEDITASLERIAAKQRELEELRNTGSGGQADVECDEAPDSDEEKPESKK